MRQSFRNSGVVLTDPQVTSDKKQRIGPSVVGVIVCGNSCFMSMNGADLLIHINIRPEEAEKGLNHDIKLLHTELCTLCGGRGQFGRKSATTVTVPDIYT